MNTPKPEVVEWAAKIQNVAAAEFWEAVKNGERGASLFAILEGVMARHLELMRQQGYKEGRKIYEGGDLVLKIGKHLYIRQDESNRSREEALNEGKRLGESERDELADVLLDMYWQYCSDGHAFMSAGERASGVLNHYGYATFDPAGRILKILKGWK